MCVDRPGHDERAVPHPLGDHLDRDAVRRADRREGVAKVMEAKC